MAKMKAPTRIDQDMASTILCVFGLSIIIVGISILCNRFALSTILSLLIGGAASVLNRYLYLIGVQIIKDNSSRKWLNTILIILRFTLMSSVALALLIIPGLNPYFGIISMFFSALSQLLINILQKSQ